MIVLGILPGAHVQAGVGQESTARSLTDILVRANTLFSNILLKLKNHAKNENATDQDILGLEWTVHQ